MNCPWCHEMIEPRPNGTCPACKNDIAVAGFTAEEETAADGYDDSSLEELIEEKFRCPRCRGATCTVKEVAMTGTGFHKRLDIQHHHYLFVSCLSCGSVEIFDPEVLAGSGRAEKVLDILFEDL